MWVENNWGVTYVWEQRQKKTRMINDGTWNRACSGLVWYHNGQPLYSHRLKWGFWPGCLHTAVSVQRRAPLDPWKSSASMVVTKRYMSTERINEGARWTIDHEGRPFVSLKACKIGKNNPCPIIIVDDTCSVKSYHRDTLEQASCETHVTLTMPK